MNSINSIGNFMQPNFRSKITITSPNIIKAYEKSSINFPMDMLKKVSNQENTKKQAIEEACNTLFEYIGNLKTKIIKNNI